MRAPAAVGVVVSLLVLSGCASAGVGPAGSPSGASDEAAYDCAGVLVHGRLLTSGAGVDTLSASGLEALRSEGLPELDDDWVVLRDDQDRVELIRELAAPDRSTGDVRTHEVLVVEPLNGDWMPTRAGLCALRYDLEGLGAAGLALDPAHPLDADASVLQLLVTEQACANGEPADGRVRTLHVEEDADAVRLTIGVETLGTASCPSNPPTAHVVELEQPLGERTVLDGSRFPALELEPWTPAA